MRVGSRSLSLSSAPGAPRPAGRTPSRSVFGRWAVGRSRKPVPPSQSHKLLRSRFHRKYRAEKSIDEKPVVEPPVCSWWGEILAHARRKRVEKKIRESFWLDSSSEVVLVRNTKNNATRHRSVFGRASGGPRAPFDPKRTAARGPKPSRAFNWERSAERGTLPLETGDPPLSISQSVRQGLGRLACSARARG